MIIAATGHRPDKLGGYSTNILNGLTDLARDHLLAQTPEAVISGMALGWDTAVACAAIELKIKLIAAIPFAGQEKIWPPAAQQRYRWILQKAAKVEVVCVGGYHRTKLQVRNEWMVDRCDRLVSLWNGAAGGTANCLFYASIQGKPHDNLWEQWNGTQRLQLETQRTKDRPQHQRRGP